MYGQRKAPVGMFEFCLFLSYRKDIMKREYFEIDEELYTEIKTLIKHTIDVGRPVGTSWIQRKLLIGYSRACRILDWLEEDKIVGPIDPKGLHLKLKL